MATIGIEHDGDGAKLTTDSAASNYGIPVLVVGGLSYGPGDQIPGREPIAWLEWANGAQFVMCRAHRLGVRDHELVRKFLGS